jgi:hypothetical protein
MIRARSTPLGRRRKFGLLSLAVAGVFGSSASAQTTSTWNGANGGSWSISANWFPSGVPLGAAGGGTNVLFTPALGSYIENGSYSTAAPLGIFTFGAAGAASGPTLTESANTLATTDEIFDTGTFSQSGGTNSVSGTLTMGNVSGDNPNYNLTGGTLTAANMIVAFEGSVTLTQSGTSTINLGSGELQLGFGFGTSTASFSGGTLNAGIIFNNGNLLQSGTSDMSLGSFDVASSGVASLSGGILNSTSITANGTLAQSGTNNINLGTGSLDVGNSAVSTGAGTANFSGGTLNASGGQVIVGNGNAGTLLQSGTSNIILGAGSLVIGDDTDIHGNGTANLSGGTLSAPGGQIVVGYNGNGSGAGTLLQSGTNNINLGTGSLIIGDGTGSTGTGSFSGGTLSAPGGQVIVGFSHGEGTLLQSGTSVINLGTGSLIVGDGTGCTGTLLQSGGVVTAGSLLVGVGGGTGTVILSGGSFNITAGPTVSAGNQVIIDPGGELNVGTLSATTAAEMVLDGGTLAVGTYSSASQFQFTAGTFDFTGPLFALNPQSIFPTANLTLPSGMAVVAAGTLSMNGGELITLNGGTLAAGTLSGGSVQFNSGAFELTSAGLQIQPTATNNWLGGTVVLNSGMQIDVTNPAATSTISPGGYLQMAGGSLTAAGTLTNSGTISGTGQVAADIVNNGTIVISANSNLQLSLGLTNAGSVILQGGNLGETGSITNQSGAEIVGHGTVQTTGGFSNSGTILFSQQDSEVSGSFTNTTTGNTTVAGNSVVTFDNTVTNITGSQFDVITGSTVVFAGNVSGAAAFTGGGVEEFLGNVTNAQPLITTGSSIVGTDANVAVTTVREQSMQIYGKVAFTPGGGTLGTGSLSSLLIANTSGAELDIADHGMVIEYGSGTSPVGDLSFAHTARNYPASSIQAYAQSGFDNFNWNGPGIMSSVAENDPNGLTAVGVADENDLLNVYPSNYTTAGGGTGTWMGQPINDPNNVLVRMTYYGDGNLDGVVNRFDVTALSQGYSGLAGYIGWSDGDYTYAGDISKIDVGLLAQSYLFQGAPLGDAITSGQAQYMLALDPDMPANVQAAFQSIAGTPEPASAGLLAIGMFGLLGRRRIRPAFGSLSDTRERA